MDFFERVKKYAQSRGMSIDQYFKTIFHGQKTRETFNGWKRRGLLPRADIALIIARDMGITVEELIYGEAGADYVRAWAQADGRVWEPPDRIADVVRGLAVLGNRELAMVRGAVTAGADKGNEKI